jgi:hypothetical protein
MVYPYFLFMHKKAASFLKQLFINTDYRKLWLHRNKRLARLEALLNYFLEMLRVQNVCTQYALAQGRE